MAGADDLEFKILANDESAAVVQKAADRAEALEKLDPTIDITADGAKAETTVRSLAERVEGLTDKQKDVVLKASVAQAEDDIKRLERGLRGFKDLSDEEIQIRLVALDKATDDLESARKLRDELSSKPADVEITADDKASGDLDRVSDQARDLDGQNVDVEVSSTGIDSVLGKLGELEGGFGKVSGALGGLSAGGGLASAAGAVAVALGAAAVSTAESAISAQSLATLTGDTVEDASRLQAVWKTSGADASDLADVALQVQGALAQTPAIAEQLGIDLSDGATGGQRLAQVLEKVRDFSGSAAEKAQLMSAVFGEEGARQAATLLSIVEDIPKALNEVNPDLVISEEQVAQAREFKLQVNKLVSEFQAVASEIGVAVIPAASDLLGILGDIAGVKIAGQGIFDISGYNAFKAAIESDDIEAKFDVTSVDEWSRSINSAQASTEAVQEATDVWGTAIDSLAEQMADAEQATKDAEQAQKDYQDTLRSAADSTFAVQRANEAWTLTITETEAKAAELQKTIDESTTGSLEHVKATNDLNEVYRKGAENAAEFADAERQWAIDQAAANGQTLSASQAMEVWNLKMLDTASTASGPLRQSIVDYIATSNGIAPEKVTDILNRYGELTPEQIIAALQEIGVGTYGATVDVNVDPALANAKRILDEINGMVARSTVQIQTVLSGAQGTPRATGGTTGIGETTIVNDGAGPEAIRLPSGSLVYTAEQTAMMRGGGGTTTNIFNLPPGLSPREVTRAQRNAQRRGFGRAS